MDTLRTGPNPLTSPASAILGPEAGHPSHASRTTDAVGGGARFAVIAAAILAVSLLGESLRRVAFGDFRDAIHGMADDELQTEMLALFGVATAGFIAWRKRPKDSLAASALLYLALAVVISLSQVTILTSQSAVSLRPSWAAVFILLFVLLVPGSLIYHFSLLLFTAVITPFMLGVWLVSHPVAGAPAPRGFELRRAPRELSHSRPALLRRMLAAMEPTWTCVIVGGALAVQRTRERNRWKWIAEELRTTRSRLRQLGAYALERRLGRGGMGEVWQATHQTLARPAAIKLINPQLLGPIQDDPEALHRTFQRFEQEAKITARLTSPHTVQVFDYGQTSDGRIFYVMELLQGADLEKVAAASGPLPPERVAAWMLDICDSLAEAHSYGLVHRDIKPANLMLCRQGLHREVIKVVDFGLAAARTAQAGNSGRIDADTITGSPHFMSPEQIRDVEVDARADLYSLGCVAWRLLTGRNVFHEETESTVLRSHMETPSPSLAEACGRSLDPQFTNLIESLLSKRPEERPPDAEAVAAEIRSLGWAAPSTPLLTPDLMDIEGDYAAQRTMVLIQPRSSQNVGS